MSESKNNSLGIFKWLNLTLGLTPFGVKLDRPIKYKIIVIFSGLDLIRRPTYTESYWAGLKELSCLDPDSIWGGMKTEKRRWVEKVRDNKNLFFMFPIDGVMANETQSPQAVSRGPGPIMKVKES